MSHPAIVQPRLPRLACIWAQGANLRTRLSPRLSICLSALLLPGLALASPQGKAPTTLEEAVAQVQQDTGGKILSADPRRFGRRMEYRIKVLTPDGHVRTFAISSEAPRAGQGKNPAGNGPGNKEKH